MKYCQLCQTTYIDSEIHFSFPEHIKKYKKEKRSLFHQVTQGKILLEDINKLLEEKVNCIYVPEFENTDTINFCLNCEPTQFTKGKTEKTLSLIAERYLINNKDDNSHVIEIIITNKSLLETKQWNIRLTKKFKGDNKIRFDILSSEKKANYKNIDTYISKLMQVRNIKDAPNILIMCCHNKRVNDDCISLLRACDGRKINLGNIKKKIKFNFSLDEPDANLGVISKFIIQITKEHKKIINNILFITATPYDDFWKMLAKHKIHKLSNIDYHTQNSQQYEKYLDDYRQLKDHIYHILNNLTDNPLEYIMDVFDKGIIKSIGKKIIFAPAHMFTKKINVGSHDEVANYFLEKGYWVYLNNSNFKGFIKPNGSRINEIEFNQTHNIDGELRDTFVKWNELHPDENIIITGYWTIERGVTINTQGFNMTHMIVSNYHMNKTNKLVQLMGRACGGKKYVKTINVICTSEIKEKVTALAENLIRLRQCNPEDYNKTDFDTKNKMATIPVKMTILQREIQDSLFKLVILKDKKETHNFLKENVQNGSIKMEDRNNIYKFSFQEYKEIKTIRKYTKEDSKKQNRRFKQMNNAFEELQEMSQTTGKNKYAIDLALDEYSYQSYVNPTYIFWITFQKE